MSGISDPDADVVTGQSINNESSNKNKQPRGQTLFDLFFFYRNPTGNK